jgi:DNA-binding transcriptional LysR family regulator
MATMNELSQLEVFVRVVGDGGFTAAAASLGVSKSFVSRQLGALEDRLGARLLNRTTRKLTLTDIGGVFYERCRRILDELIEAEGTVTSLQTSPRGTLKVALPMSFGVSHGTQEVARFLERHPELSVEMDLSDRRVDLLGEGFDLAIRIGVLSDSRMIARKLASSCLVLVASPAYLDAHGRPNDTADLRRHACLQYAYNPSGQTWRLSDGKREASVTTQGRVSANNGEALREMAKAGQGIARLPDFIVNAALADGSLEQVLPEWAEAGVIWAVYPHSRHLSAKVRLFVEFLAERWASPPWARLAAAAPAIAGRRRTRQAGRR